MKFREEIKLFEETLREVKSSIGKGTYYHYSPNLFKRFQLPDITKYPRKPLAIFFTPTIGNYIMNDTKYLYKCHFKNVKALDESNLKDFCEYLYCVYGIEKFIKDYNEAEFFPTFSFNNDYHGKNVKKIFKDGIFEEEEGAGWTENNVFISLAKKYGFNIIPTYQYEVLNIGVLDPKIIVIDDIEELKKKGNLSKFFR
jgi:hypothetical protein